MQMLLDMSTPTEKLKLHLGFVPVFTVYGSTTQSASKLPEENGPRINLTQLRAESLSFEASAIRLNCTIHGIAGMKFTDEQSAAAEVKLDLCFLTLITVRLYSNDEEKGDQSKLDGIKKLIEIHSHQVFIADPNLVKLVHCQYYPSELLPLLLFEDAINSLIKSGQIQISRLASTQRDFICTLKSLQKSVDLEEINWDEAKSFLSSLPSIDLLCHTIKQSVKTLY
uniref:Uncharacterized protein n=1 Tax=Tetranychus urticae TaxID=32264 RepID=T1L598_TETUR